MTSRLAFHLPFGPYDLREIVLKLAGESLVDGGIGAKWFATS